MFDRREAAAPSARLLPSTGPVARVLAFAFALVLAAAAAGALLWSRVTDISVRGAPLERAALPAGAARPEVAVGVVSRLARSTLYEGYQPILDHLSRRTRWRYRLRPAGGYREAVDDLVAGRTRAAFLGALLYVEARAEHGVVPLVRPRNAEGEPTFESVLVARQHSPIRSIADLDGLTVAVPPLDTVSARWLVVAAPAGVRFSRRAFGHHPAVAQQVLRGAFAAGIVKDRIAADYLHRGLRVVARSGPLPSGPLVVARDTDPALADAVSGALLALDRRRPADRAVLDGFDPEFVGGFAPARDEDYEAVRRLLERSPEAP